MKYQAEPLNEMNSLEWDHALIDNDIHNPFQSGKFAIPFLGDGSFRPIGRIVREKRSKKISGGYVYYTFMELKGIPGQFTKRSICIGSPVCFSDNKELLLFLLFDLINNVQSGGIYLEIWHDKLVKHPDIYEKFGFIHEEHLNYFIHLEKGKQKIWNGIHKRRKKYINFFTPSLVIKTADSIEDFNKCYSLLMQTYKRIKLPLFNRNVFLKVFREKNGIFYLAEKDGNPIAARVILSFNKGYYDWFAGDDRSLGDFHGSDCLLWKIFLNGIDQNISIFNFGGAGKPSVPYGPRDYKATYGGELVNFGRHKLIINKNADLFLNQIIKFRKWIQVKQ